MVRGIYQTPKAPVEHLTELHEFLCGNVNDRTRFMLAGDFSLPAINWVNVQHDMTEVGSSEQLLQNALMFSLNQAVTEPTRICGKTSFVLDLIFFSSNLENLKVSAVDGISVQKLLVTTCLLKNVHCKKPVVTVKDYSRADDSSVLDYLETCFDKFVTLGNFDIMWRTFKEIVTHCETNYIPNR